MMATGPMITPWHIAVFVLLCMAALGIAVSLGIAAFHGIRALVKAFNNNRRSKKLNTSDK